MITNKKLSKVKAEVASLLSKLPGRSAQKWLAREAAIAADDPKRDVETLEMLLGVLERKARKVKTAKRRRMISKR